MIDTRRKLLKELSAKQFALVEMVLYLDTHPNDKAAIAKKAELKTEVKKLTREFEEKYGPLTFGVDTGEHEFEWVNDPWPWEKEAN